MGIETGIVARVLSIPAVTNEIGNRLYADVIPDGAARPSIAYQLLGTEPISNLNADTGKESARVQFTVIADNKLDAITLSNALRTALQRYQGPADDITILDSRLVDVTDQPYDLTTGVTARVVDFLIYYE